MAKVINSWIEIIISANHFPDNKSWNSIGKVVYREMISKGLSLLASVIIWKKCSSQDFWGTNNDACRGTSKHQK